MAIEKNMLSQNAISFSSGHMASVASPLDRRPLTLHKCCIKVIRRTIGLARLESVTGLALPAAISSEITSLCLNDFEIDKDAVAHGSDEFPSFPATCLIDGSQVYVMVFEEGNYLHQLVHWSLQ